MTSVRVSSAVVFIACLFLVGSIAQAQRQAQCCEPYCFDSDSERVQAAHFGTKTSYSIARGRENHRQFLVPNCNPVKIWMYARHGTRLPMADSLDRLKQLEFLRDEIINNYEKRHSKPDIGAMCEGDLDLLKNWRWNNNITADKAEYLTTQGWDELKFLAIRFQRTFPNIMENIYDQSRVLFRYTNTQRTEASFKGFVEGLYGPNAYEHVHVAPPPANDTLLRPYDYCPAYENYNAKGENSEYRKFLNSQTVTQLVSDVSQRLGYKFPLKNQQILDMFDMCRYEQAWDIEKKSPWCTAFTPSQIEVLEYLEDLDKYWKSGYGQAMNSRLQCAAVNDMLQHMGSNQQPRAIVSFTHSKALILLVTALSASKDSDSLRADNYYIMSRRKFRSSEITPFASNVVALKFDCPNEPEREKVMFFINEKPLAIDWCKVGLCNWSEVKERYKEFAQNNCNEYFCTGSSSTRTISTVLAPILALVCWFMLA